MKVRCSDASKLAYWLSHAASIAKKSTNPATEFIAIGANNSGMAVIGLNDISSYYRSVAADLIEVMTDGSVAVKAAKLIGAVKTYGKQAVTLEKKDNHLLLSSGRSRIRCDVMDTDDFPIPDQPTEKTIQLTVNLNSFKYGLVKVRGCMPQTDDVRTALNGIHLKIERGLMSFIATDGHKISCIKLPIDPELNPHLKAETQIAITIPKKIVNESLCNLQSESEEIVLSICDTSLAVTTGSLRLTAKLIDDNYPELSGVMPKTSLGSLIVHKKSFGQLLDRVSVSMSDVRVPRLGLDINPSGLITFEGGVGTDIVVTDEYTAAVAQPIVIENLADKLQTAFNYGYLKTVVSMIDTDQVLLSFGKTVVNNKEINQISVVVSPVSDGLNYYQFSLVIPMR
ncbi:DNA polymerase III subunit beta [Photobacterium sp. ZSDE20]|uniref:Beta sliding clamp n=1 Tax=Photobacterium pectinilyticum TaxID=2906793 RepID=A0ABT1N0X3_9GAMM|nr:DNA polymerase III subunit beta [Photobacterium sp. ZSDE20]MCQ1058386.1 DNA polymerase III subunit beta [Photobacterium sp. ZSDE20]MDD1825251.1 DNA polymerase III subunit beta [Photobacterium sp. ZSDE20]